MTGIVYLKFSQAMTLPNQIDKYFNDLQTAGRMLQENRDDLPASEERIIKLNEHKDKIMKVLID